MQISCIQNRLWLTTWLSLLHYHLSWLWVSFKSEISFLHFEQVMEMYVKSLYISGDLLSPNLPQVCMYVSINQSISHSLPTPTIPALQIPLLSTAWISLPRFNGFTVSSVVTHKWVPGEQTHQNFHSLHAFQETHSALWQAFEVQSDLAWLHAASELTLMPSSLDSHLPSLESSGWLIRRIWSLGRKTKPNQRKRKSPRKNLKPIQA